MAAGKVFRIDLAKLIATQNASGYDSQIPALVEDAVYFLQANNVTPDVFQAAAHAPAAKAVRDLYDQELITYRHPPPTSPPTPATAWLAQLDIPPTPQAMVGVLKSFLQELPEHLTGRKHYHSFLHMMRVPDPVLRITNLRVLLYLLPKVNTTLTLFLLRFMHSLALKGTDVSSLCTNFAPVMFRSEDPSSGNDAYAAALLKLLVMEYSFVSKAAVKPLNTDLTPLPMPLPVPGPIEDIAMPRDRQRLKARALYPFDGSANKWLLTLKKDDPLTIVDIKTEDGWLKGEIDNKGAGYFPTTYVDIFAVPASSTSTPAPPSISTPPIVEEVATRKMSLNSATPLASPAHQLLFGRTTSVMMGSRGGSAIAIPTSLPSSPVTQSPALSSPALPPPNPMGERRSPYHTLTERDRRALSLGPAAMQNVLLSPPPALVLPPQTSPNMPALANAFTPPTPITLASTPPPPAILTPPPPLSTLPSPRRTTSTLNISPPTSVPPSPAPSSDRRKGSLSSGSATNLLPPPPSSLPPPPPSDLPPPPPDSMLPPPPLDVSNLPPPPPLDASSIPPPPPPANLPPPPPLANFSAFSAAMEPSNKTPEGLAKEQKRRERAEEVLTTERTYVKQLSTVVELFVDPLKKRVSEKAPLLSGEDIFSIFSNIEVLLTCHRKLLEALQERMTNWDSTPQLGDIFLKNTSFIKLYKYYVNNFDKSIVTLKSAREKNAAFKKMISELDYTPQLSGLSVESFLILPVQRIPRYVLLLQELLRYTDNNHPDFNGLCEALSFIKELADYINSNKSDAENINRILAIQDILTDYPEPTLVVPRRRFIDEGVLLKDKKTKMHVFLFTDILLLTKPEKKTKKYKGFIGLQTASLNTKDEPGVIKIIATQGTFRFSCETPKDTEHWLRLLTDTFEQCKQAMLSIAFGGADSSEGSEKYRQLQDADNAKKKLETASQLVTEEEDYVKELEYIDQTFLAPLRRSLDGNNPLLSRSEYLDISTNFCDLLRCHQEFLRSLKDRLNEWEINPKLSDVFNEKGKFLKLYNMYVREHDKSLATVDSCLDRNPLFAMLIREVEKNEKAEFKMLLTTPLRRISQYMLALQQIKHLTRPKHDDHEALGELVHMFEEQTKALNQGLQESLHKKVASKPNGLGKFSKEKRQSYKM
eukprot:TRINITY_DN4510_c1_g1_i2.p1 TRINITY_DN4510_c1_g1~~TRINITY_DN4510_c1_g1_i2.p1  ORF type:complete len:1156 (-),score=386.35 TRINITY_DN4510_c1_g1_i2:12-3479(-)